MFHSRKGPSINFLGPGKRRFPGGSPAGYPARKVYVYVVFSQTPIPISNVLQSSHDRSDPVDRLFLDASFGSLFPLTAFKTTPNPKFGQNLSRRDCFSGFQSGGPKFVKNLPKIENCPEIVVFRILRFVGCFWMRRFYLHYMHSNIFGCSFLTYSWSSFAYR